MIPKLHYISQGDTRKEHLENIQNACNAGVELVRLNINITSEKKFLKVAMEAREITSHFQTRLLICGNYKIAKEIKADGLHLEKTDPCPTIARAHLYPWQLIGGTANNLHDCEILIGKEVDYIGLGPFKVSGSKDVTPLDSNGYTEILKALDTETPIIGFGDIHIDDVAEILKTGVSGISVSEAITLDFNSVKTFNQLLNTSSTAEQRYKFE